VSWDVFITKERVPLGSDEPPNAAPLGSSDSVRAAVVRSLPETDWSDPAWGVLEGQGWSIEFNLGKDAPVMSFMLHVRGGGDPISAIARLCADNDWHALVLSAGDYIDLRAPSDAGWRSFQGFREGVVVALEAKARRRRIVRVILPALLAVLVVVLKRVFWN
jgi:hypothetical protein